MEAKMLSPSSNQQHTGQPNLRERQREALTSLGAQIAMLRDNRVQSGLKEVQDDDLLSLPSS